MFANFGGVPLAFLFIATLSTTGVVTGLDQGHLRRSTSGDHGFTLYTAYGVFFVYMYFQIPLMVLVILPALEGLRPAWREAAQNMGAGTWQYWRYVGGPVLFPSFLGCLLLLFGSAFSAYATAEALTGGTDRADPDPDRGAAERQRPGWPAEPRLRARPDHGRHHRDRHDHLHDRRSGGRHDGCGSDARGRGADTVADARSAGGRRSFPVWRWVILLLAGIYFLIPLYAALQVRRLQGIPRYLQAGRLRLRDRAVAAARA